MYPFWRAALPLTLIGLSTFFLPAIVQAQAGADQPEAFDQVFAEWKDLLKELRDLQARFVIAEEDEVPQIRDQYNQKVQAGHNMVPRLREAALRSYVSAPNTDRELTRFLVKLADDDARTDQYASAFKIAQTMLENDCDERVLYDIAGTAAFGTNQFELAQQYLKEAESLGILNQGKKHLPVIAAAKQNWAVEEKIRAAEAEADDLPRVRVTTNKGDIVLELFENEAPDTVGNFISLVEKGFYDGLTFHRVLPGFMAQAGSPKGDGSDGPGYTIYCECRKDNFRRHFAGSLSMAKTPARDSGGSQFFLTFVPTSQLDGEHTVFGRVLEGFDTLTRIQRRDPDSSEQLTIVPDKILKAEVIRKRPGSEYVPNKSSEVGGG